MEVDQRTVTTVNLHQGNVSGFALRKDARGYQLSIVARDHVVNVLLPPQELQRLRQEIFHADTRETPRESYRTVERSYRVPEIHCTATDAVGTHNYEWNTIDWLAFN